MHILKRLLTRAGKLVWWHIGFNADPPPMNPYHP